MLKNVPLTALISGLFVLAANVSHAASFDCDQAKSPDEKTICANRALNDMDVTLALLYSLDRKFLPMGGRDDLTGQQQAWLKSRGACGADQHCLKNVYERRIQTLHQIIDTRVVPHGPF